jgi:outer membrane protein assembly factor BamE
MEAPAPCADLFALPSEKHPAATMNHHIASPPAMPANTRFSPPVALLTLACALLLAGCAGTQSSTAHQDSGNRLFKPAQWIKPFKPDVIQGNFISREQVELLRPGMSRTDVRNVLGTPLVASIFHADRWDYVFTIERQGVPAQSYRYAVFFNGDSLVRFEGDTMPAEADFIARLDKRRELGKVPQLEATPEQLEVAQKKAAAAAPRTPTASAPEPAPVPPTTAGSTTYPPLENTRP